MFGTTSPPQSGSSQRIFVPKDYQSEAIRFLLENPEAGLFLGTGLGKTVCFLTAFYILKRQGIVNKALIIAKRRIIHNVWPKEVEKWGLPFKVVKVHGNEKQRLRRLEEDGDIYLCTYQAIDWLSTKSNEYETIDGERVLVRKKIPKELRTQFDWLCLDESSMVKNWNAVRSRRLRTMLPTFDRRTILTASPIPKSMMDIFSQVYCLDMGDALGRYIGQFRNSFWTPIPRAERGREWNDYELAEDGEQRIYDKLKPLVIRFPKDTLKLPPLYKVERPVQLPPAARKAYRELEELFITEVQGGVVTAANSGVATQKLRQLAGGAVYNHEGAYDDDKAASRNAEWSHLHDAKLDELQELIEELQGEPLLVAYEFDHERQRIQARFPDIPYIGGGTSDAEADELIDQWNAGELPVLLGHPDSIAHGLNLQESGWNICFFGIGWNLENHTQFIDRVYRQGQEHAVYVYLLVAEDTVDEAIVLNLEDKEEAQDRLLSALTTNILTRTHMQDWKEVKLPKKLPDIETVAKAFLARHTAKWVPTWEVHEDPQVSVHRLVSSIMVALGGWLPSKHASFQNEVLRTKSYKEEERIDLLFVRTQAIIFTCLRLSTEGETFLSTEPGAIGANWPNKQEDLTMAKQATKKAPAKKTAAKKAPANKRAAVGGRTPLVDDTSVTFLRKADAAETQKLRGLRKEMVTGLLKLAKGKPMTYAKVAAYISKQESDKGVAQVASGWVRWMERDGFVKLTAAK